MQEKYDGIASFVGENSAAFLINITIARNMYQIPYYV